MSSFTRRAKDANHGESSRDRRLMFVARGRRISLEHRVHTPTGWAKIQPRGGDFYEIR